MNLCDIMSQSRQVSKSQTKELYWRSAVNMQWSGHRGVVTKLQREPPSDEFSGKNGLTKMVNKAVISRKTLLFNR